MSRRKQSKYREQKLPPIDKVIGVSLDHTNKVSLIYTEDMLVNTIKRDAPKIAKSFDKLCNHQLEEISKLISNTLMLISKGLTKASQENDELRMACLKMLANATNSFSAAATLLRNGYRLQPGILTRSIIETISSVLHLFISQDDLKDFREGRLKSSRTIDAAKKVLPPFGQLYGFFSDEFAHIGTLHQNLQPITLYTELDDALQINISFLRLTSWLLYVTTELICYETVDNHRYWQDMGENEQGHLYAYNPSDDERQWQANYLALVDI